MLDARARRYIDPPLNAVGRHLVALGVSPNAVTVAGFGIGALSFPALAYQAYWIALALILLNRVLDGLDGAVARYSRPSDLGGFLDISLDFIFYSGVIFFFAVGRPEMALPAAFLIFSFVGTGGSFLAFAVVAAKRNMSTSLQGQKSIYYAGGLAEGTETIIVFVLICLFPDYFAAIAFLFGVICWVTTSARILGAVRIFRVRSPGGSSRLTGGPAAAGRRQAARGLPPLGAGRWHRPGMRLQRLRRLAARLR